jgi:exonuclease 3'-5' domain-containing protein 1
VVDIWTMQTQAINQVASASGLTLKAVFESTEYIKVWFDPRNDVDALYHQYAVMPKRIFDLQLAEVADRRAKNLTVK